ncbi:MAG: ATP-dependent DNA helicase [Myxococcaceae bacterium]|nr:ATP-dependent DNA helicase [Myxococcaceae bacterium]
MTKSLSSLFGLQGPMAKALSNYKPRPAQLAMAHAIQRLLNTSRGRLMIEAGTGTGKSLAYLLTTLNANQKILVSTATKTLQDQLFQKDIPLALKILGVQKNVVLMKGRANYLCLLKAEQFNPTAELIDGQENKRIDAVRSWIKKTETGDRAELTVLPEDSPWWNDLNASADTCLGSSCPLYADCFVTRLRKSAQGAEVLVVNHSLLCADHRSDEPFGRILPKVDVWILDEAHTLEDVATKAFGMEITGRQMRYLARDLRQISPLIAQTSQTQFLEACEAILPLFTSIADHWEKQEIAGFVQELQPKLAFLEICLTSAKQELLSRRLHKISTELNFMLSPKTEHSGFVIFSERDSRGQVLSAAPIEPSEVLKNTLWAADNPIALTSATLALNRRLEPIQSRMGLSCEGLILEPPFDSLNQAALYTPANPMDLESEIKRLIDLSQGGTFVLFTSYRAMNSTYEALKHTLENQGLLVLKQGDAPKLELIARFVEADKTFGAVLFATHSFWEGVDVQGKTLRMVIIDRLPFKSPEDPIHKARCQLMESRRENSFFGLSLPQAALSLKQGVGRLLRTDTDRGAVAILDPRIIQKGYGRLFMEALPPMTRVDQFEKLKEFWGDGWA